MPIKFDGTKTHAEIFGTALDIRDQAEADAYIADMALYSCKLMGVSVEIARRYCLVCLMNYALNLPQIAHVMATKVELMYGKLTIEQVNEIRRITESIENERNG